MLVTKEDLEGYTHAYRLNLVNSISGPKQVSVIGTVSESGVHNLGVFNSVQHLGSSPALLGFILRPSEEVRRDTWENIKETGVFTVNHVNQNFLINAHYTSAKMDAEASEFDRCNLTVEKSEGFVAPFVRESTVQIALKFVERIDISINNTSLIIGEIQHINIPDTIVDHRGYVDYEKGLNVVVSGLNRYYKVERIMDLPFARVNEIPRF